MATNCGRNGGGAVARRSSDGSCQEERLRAHRGGSPEPDGPVAGVVLKNLGPGGFRQ